VQQGRLGHGAARAVGDEQRLVAIALDEDHGELVAPHAREDVLLA
jgi:hypothetical protein